MITKRMNTNWKRPAFGILLTLILFLWVRTLMAAGLPESYYDFECASGNTAMPINMQSSTNHYLIGDDNIAWTASGQFAGQTVSWSGNQTVKKIHYYVTDVPSGVQATFKFTIGSTVRYKSVASNNNNTWMDVNFGSKSGQSVRIERTDANGGNIKLHEVRTCVTPNSNCSISGVSDNVKTPGQDELEGKDTLKRYIIIVTGNFTPSSCTAPATARISVNGASCTKGSVLRVRQGEMEIRFKKSCFSSAGTPSNMAPVQAELTVGGKPVNFHIAYWPNEAVWFIH